MKRLLLIIAMLAILASMAVAVAAVLQWHAKLAQQQAARHYLEQAARAESQLNYRAWGVSSTLFCGQRISSRVLVFRSGPRWRVEYGPGRMIAGADGLTVWRYYPGGRAFVRPQTSRDHWQDLREILNNYVLSCLGDGKVAGRLAHRVTLRRLRAAYPAQELWLDRDTHAVLRWLNLDSSGRAITSTEITRIDYQARLPASLFSLPAVGLRIQQVLGPAVPMPVHALARELGLKVLRPGYLPKGYRLVGAYLYHCPCCPGKSAQLRYSDGVSSFSIFQADPRQGSCVVRTCEAIGQAGQPSDYGAGLACGVLNRQGQVVVVGDLSPQQMRLVVQSVK